MSTPALPGNKGPIHPECPIDQIEQALTNGYQQVNLRITRRAPDGQWATVESDKIIDTKDLFNLESYLRSKAGGGKYVIEVRNPANLKEYVIERYYIVMEGLPMPVQNTPAAPYMGASVGPSPMSMPSFGAGMSSNGPVPTIGIPSVLPGSSGMPPPAGNHGPQAPVLTTPGMPMQLSDMYDQYGRLKPPPDLPNWFRSYPAEQQWAIYQQMNPGFQMPRPPTGASMYSDQAMAYAEQNTQRELSTAKQNQTRAEERLAALERELRAQAETAKEREQQARLEAEKAKHEADLRALRAEMESWKHQSTSKAPEKSWVEMAAGLAPFVPVFVEYVKSNKHQQEVAMQAQNKHMEVLVAAMKQDAPKTDSTMEIFKALTPVFTQMMENRSPQAIMQAQHLSNESQLAMLKFVQDVNKDLIHAQQQTSEAQPPSWFPLVTGVLETVKEAAAANVLKNAMEAPALGAPPQPQAPQIPTHVQVQSSKIMPDLGSWVELEKTNPVAAQATRLVFNNLDPKLGFHKPEWKILIFNLHHQLDPVTFASIFADTIDHFTVFGLIPGLLDGIHEKPVEVATKLIGVLPIAQQNAAYAKAVIEAIGEEITTRERERKMVDKETDEEAAEEEAIEPAEVLTFTGKDVKDGKETKESKDAKPPQPVA